MSKRSKECECLEPKCYLYRYDLSEIDYDYHLNVYKYLIHSETPCGVWIYSGEFARWKGKLRFVNLSAKKRWACPTIEEAKESYIRRKQRQIVLLRSQLENSKVGLEMIQNNLTCYSGG